VKTFLSPRELGQAIGVSESSLKRWADEGRLEVARTAGGHRRIHLSEAVRFVRASGLQVVKPQMLGLADLAEASGAAGEETAALQEALIEGNGPRIRGIILSMYLAGMSVAELCDGPIVTAMQHIGTLWEHNHDGVFIEHRATDLCMAALNQLRTLIPPPVESAPVAVGGCTEGDPYALASLMAATVLASDGWREMNLGANTPDDALIAAARSSEARLAWLGVNMHQPAEDLVDRIRRIAEALGPEVMLVGGGRSWPKRIAHAPSNMHTVSSMAELAALARGLRTAQALPQ